MVGSDRVCRCKKMVRTRAASSTRAPSRATSSALSSNGLTRRRVPVSAAAAVDSAAPIPALSAPTRAADAAGADAEEAEGARPRPRRLSANLAEDAAVSAVKKVTRHFHNLLLSLMIPIFVIQISYLCVLCFFFMILITRHFFANGLPKSVTIFPCFRTVQRSRLFFS